MKTIKIVADSSANLLELEKTPFAVAPLKVIADTREFVDDAALDVNAMVSWFDSYKGKSQTSCPNPTDWLEAFADADEVYCVTITSGLSGSYNAACIAKQMYESENEGKRVCVIDSLSAGPELVLIIEKLEQYIGQGMSFDDICREIEAYKQNTGLAFMLESLKNFADNRYFKGFLKGVKPVIVALILSTGTILLAGVVGFSALTLHAESCILFALLCGVYFLVKKCFKKKLPAVAIVGIAAALGVAVCAIADKFC